MKMPFYFRVETAHLWRKCRQGSTYYSSARISLKYMIKIILTLKSQTQIQTPQLEIISNNAVPRLHMHVRLTKIKMTKTKIYYIGKMKRKMKIKAGRVSILNSRTIFDHSKEMVMRLWLQNNTILCNYFYPIKIDEIIIIIIII